MIPNFTTIGDHDSTALIYGCLNLRVLNLGILKCESPPTEPPMLPIARTLIIGAFVLVTTGPELTNMSSIIPGTDAMCGVVGI